MGIIELYSSITEENTVAQDNVQSDYDNVLDDVAMNRAQFVGFDTKSKCFLINSSFPVCVL